MKILFVLEYYYPYIGGSEKLFQSLAESLAEKNHEVTIITTRFDDTLPKNELVNNVNIIRINCKNRFLFIFYALPYLCRIISKFDIIHTTTYTAALPTWIACTLFRKKCLLTFHEYWNQLWFELPFLSFTEKWSFYLFEKLIYKLPFHKIIAVSDFTASELIKNGKKNEKIIRIHNGLDYQSFPNISNTSLKEFSCTYFGRLGVSKGLDILIPSINLHCEKHPSSIFNLVLPKVPKKMYLKIIYLIDELKIDNIRIHHHLEKEKLHHLIRQSSCVIIPSYSEGFCFSAVETIALGVPVIHSNQGALKETVSGKQIKMKAMNVKSLCNALEKAIRNEWEETDIRSFPLDASVDAYVELYKTLNTK